MSTDSPESGTTVHRRKKRKQYWKKANLFYCKHQILRIVLNDLGTEEVDPLEDEEWGLLWTDTTAPMSTILQLKPYQRCNHFPGMNEIARKDLLGRNINRMTKAFPKEYNFFPNTWTLPADYAELRAHMLATGNKKQTYIVKPDASSQGKGIYLTRSLDEIDQMGHIIVQKYISRPLLVDNLKFDLRIYVLVTSCSPLRIYLYREGLARFATEQYVAPTHSNMDKMYMHLTNYSINKNSENFVVDEDNKGLHGSKRSITSVLQLLQEQGHDSKKIWQDIADIIIKTMISIQPKLAHIYNTCFPSDHHANSVFELMGFDVLLAKTKGGTIKPWLLEVNHSPSMNIDTPFDRDIKYKLLTDTFTILSLKENEKRRSATTKNSGRLYEGKKTETKEAEHIDEKMKKLQTVISSEIKWCAGTDFDRIYLYEEDEKYKHLYVSVPTPETNASVARREKVMKQMEEREKKEREGKTVKKSKPPKPKEESTVVTVSPRRQKESPRMIHPTNSPKIVTHPTTDTTRYRLTDNVNPYESEVTVTKPIVAGFLPVLPKLKNPSTNDISPLLHIKTLTLSPRGSK
ncbi:hypothetical protein PROFUN_01832 [Planoprotostelium fungivorum]|uniref:Tubulin polyglutamylase TTLL6-like n=1 Tax=Planoprotostelium fungivorum TaxID=1890364 RepID=A0A2P6NYU6_9EUKA|nr:hypothetical protein PROFUN_01832 [Planoprotostelium fungivorum]